jgi:hypothetical protein
LSPPLPVAATTIATPLPLRRLDLLQQQPRPLQQLVVVMLPRPLRRLVAVTLRLLHLQRPQLWAMLLARVAATLSRPDQLRSQSRK